MSNSALRLACLAGAVVSLIGVSMIVVSVLIWNPLASAPAWWVSITAFVVISGIVSTIIASSSLARRTARPPE